MSTSPPPSPTLAAKRTKLPDDATSAPAPVQTTDGACQHFVTRKKRFCKMTVARGRDYCGEHLPAAPPAAHEDSYIPADKRAKRIPCPLDPKHTVYAWNVAKHVRICNAKAPATPAVHIERGINLGAAVAGSPDSDPAIKLSALPEAELLALIATVQRVYDEHSIDEAVTALHLDHPSMQAELAREHYGAEALKHLRQTAALLGHLQHWRLLDQPVATSYIEFGAGKGHLSYWLAQVVKSTAGANVLLVDRASHRHKQDNKVTEADVVHRIRADIADLRLQGLAECAAAERLVGVGKHLCGAATDLAVRCMLQEPQRMAGCVVALCCHHRCEWQSFVGKEWFERNGLGRREFAVMTRLVSWAVCGTGMSRETRRALQERAGAVGVEEAVGAATTDTANVCQRLTRAEREEIGRKCKRLLDVARVEFMRERFAELEVSLHYYVPAEVTLENVVIVARRKVDGADSAEVRASVE